MNTKLSVVIPTKNRPHFLERLVTSFINFTEYIQLIVVDDGSDSVVALQNQKICEQISSCCYTYVPISKGAAAARNIGMAKSSCEYIWFIDDDDQVSSKTISDVLKALSIGDADVLLLPMTVMYDDLVLNKIIPIPEKNNFENYRRNGQPINTSCAIIKRQEVMKIGGWDEKLIRGDDTSLFLLLSRNCDFVCIDTASVIMNVGHSDRMTRGAYKEQFAKLQFLRKHWHILSVKRRMYYIVSFLIFLPYFLPFRLKWQVFKTKRNLISKANDRLNV